MLSGERRLDTYENEEEKARRFLEKFKKALETEGETVEIRLGRAKKPCFLLKSNLEKLVKYCEELILNKGLKAYSVSRILDYVLQFLKFIENKPVENVKKDDVLSYLRALEGKSERYRFVCKVYLKNFLRWCNLVDVGNWIECKFPKYKVDDSKKLSIEEVQRMIDACDNPRDKALVATLYESGARIGELLSARLKDLKFDEFGAILYISKSKTTSRKIRLMSSVPLLKNFINNFHPFKNDGEAPLFPSFCPQNYGGFLKYYGAWVIIRKSAKRAKLDKNIHPHMFRHSRASHLAGSVLHEPEMRIFFGWSRNSSMPSVYVHLDEEQVNSKIMQVNGIEAKKPKPPKLPTIECYKCGEVNNATSTFCWKCGAPLQQESIQKINVVKKMVEEVMVYIFEKMKERKIGEEDLEEIVKEWAEKKNI